MKNLVYKRVTVNIFQGPSLFQGSQMAVPGCGRCMIGDQLDNSAIPLKNIVAELLEGNNALIDPLIPAVIQAWGQVVPESLRQGITMERIREGTLHLSVSNPVVGQQFQFLKESIREKMNTLLGAKVIKRIMVKPGPALAQSPSGKKKGLSPRLKGKTKGEEL